MGKYFREHLYRYIFLGFVLWLGSFNVVHAQVTGAEGFVLDDATGQGLPFTNIYFAHTSIGTTSDTSGRFKIRTTHKVDTLVFSQVGYSTVKLGLKKGDYFHLVVRMKENDMTLGEVVIKPGENPAFSIIRQVIRHRKKNDPNHLPEFSTDTYTKITAGLTHIKLADIKNKLLKQLQKFLPRLNDTSTMGFLPLFYSEKLTDNFIDRKAHLSESRTIYHRENGFGMLKDLQISGYTNSLSTVMNFYDNYVGLFGHNFVSPIGALGRSFYKYYLSDSLKQNGRMIYTIKYVPRNKKDLAFRGKFTVVKGLWAIKHIDASLPQVANINFLNRFVVSYNYQIVDDSLSFFKGNRIEATFNYNKLPNNKRIMLQVDKVSIYKNVLIGKAAHRPAPEEKVGLSHRQAAVSDSLIDQYRNISRNSISGPNIMRSIDSINNVGWVRFLNKTSNMFVTGYYSVGKLEIGPFLNLVQYNRVEGLRLSFGGRTGALFNRHYSFAMLGGYGFKDKQWKYNTSFTWKFNTPKRTILRLKASKNLQLFGVYGYIHLIKENTLTVGEDSFISAIFKRAQNERRAMFYKYNALFEHEWKRGFTTSLKLEADVIQDNHYVPFIQSGIDIGQIKNQELTAKIRLSWHEKILDRFLRRYYLGTHYPIINILGTFGRYEAGSQAGNYYKIHMTLKQRFNAGIPMIRYIVETGASFGKMPFPLLEIQRGNESYGYSRYRFNLLNNATIASDRYFSFMGESFMNGLLLNRVPLIRRLNLRCVFSVKYLYSRLSNSNGQVVDFPWNMHLPGHQYLEGSFGIDNIFKFLRVDFVYRFLPVNFAPMPKYGVRVKIDVNL